MSKSFSTGIPHLDAYIGGIRQGDAILWILERTRYLQPIVTGLTAYCRKFNIPIVTILASSSGFFKHFEPLSKATLRAGELKQRQSRSIHRAILSFLARNAKRSCIIVDDASLWKELFRSEKPYIALFHDLVRAAARNNSLLFASVQRSALSSQAIAEVKDKATVSLELIERKSELYCIPLSTVGRYVPYRLFPLNIRSKTHHSVPAKSIVEYPSEYPEKVVDKYIADIRDDIFSTDERYKRLFTDAGEPMALIHGESGFREINQALAGMLGFSTGELLTKPLTGLISPEDRQTFLRNIVAARKKKQWILRFHLITSKARPLPVEIRCSSFGNGWYLCILDDLTKRESERAIRKTLQETKKSEQTFRALASDLPHATAIFIGKKLVYANSAFFQLLRFPVEQSLQGKNIFEFFASESAPLLKKQLSTLGAQKSVSVDLKLQSSSGSEVFCSCSLTKTSYSGRHAVLLVMKDISETKKIVDELRTAFDQSMSLAQHSRDAMCVVNPGGIVFANAAFLSMFGYSQFDEIVSKEPSHILLPSHLKKVHRQLEQARSGERITLVTTGTRKDGSALEVELSCENIIYGGESAMLIHVSDISAKKLLEQELQILRFENNVISKTLALLQQHTTATEASSMHEVLPGILQELKFPAGGIYLIDDANHEFHLTYRLNVPEPVASSLAALQRDEGLAGLVAKTFEPHIFSISSYPSYLPYRGVFADNGIRTVGLIPLAVDDRIVGILLLLSPNEVHDRVFLPAYRTLGRLLGTALENSTKHKILEETLDKQQKILDFLPEIVYSRTADGRFLFIGSGIEALTGYTPGDFLRNRSLWLSIVHPDDKKELLIQQANLEGLPNTATNEYRILPKGKAEYLLIRDSFSLIRDNSDNILQINGILTEIALVKQSEQHDDEPREETMRA